MIKKEISKRILTSIVLLPIVIFTILSKNIYFNILIGVIYILSLREWYNISKKGKKCSSKSITFRITKKRSYMYSLQHHL